MDVRRGGEGKVRVGSAYETRRADEAQIYGWVFVLPTTAGRGTRGGGGGIEELRALPEWNRYLQVTAGRGGVHGGGNRVKMLPDKPPR